MTAKLTCACYGLASRRKHWLKPEVLQRPKKDDKGREEEQ